MMEWLFFSDQHQVQGLFVRLDVYKRQLLRLSFPSLEALSSMQHNHLCRYLFSIAFISIFAIPRAVFASQVTMSGADVDWMSIFAIIFIFLVIAGLVWLSFYVKKERANHVQVMIWMYSSVLDGKLRNLIINLQDSVELLCSDNFDNELLSVSQDSFWRLGDKRLRADFLAVSYTHLGHDGQS